MNNPLHIKSFLKFLGRNKLYTAINIFGLSVSLMFVIIVALFAYRELSVDSWHEKKERIYALGDEEAIGSTNGIETYLTDRYPDIEAMCGTFVGDPLRVGIDDEYKYADILYADSTFFDIFTFRMISGDGKRILSSPGQAIISADFAKSVFGNDDPTGKVLDIDGKYTVTVEGIIADMGNTIFPACDIITGMPQLFKAESWRTPMNSVGGGFNQFILLREGSDLPSRTAELADYFRTFFWTFQRGWSQEVTLTQLEDIYLSPLNEENGLRRGNRSTLMILIVVAFVILVFAVLNYINLTVAQTGFRAKEMATRGLLGASRSEIFLKFILESVTVCAIAFLIGLLLAGAFQSIIGNMLQARIDVWHSLTWGIGGIFAIFVIILGSVAGVIPAIHIARYRPIDVVRGTFRQKSKMIFSKVFIVFQNVITIALVASSLVIMSQLKHMINMPLGYNTENLLYVWLWEVPQSERDKVPYFRNELESLASVERITMSSGHPFQGGNNNTDRYNNEKDISYQLFMADSTFFDILDLKIVRDYNVTSTEGYWVTRRVLLEQELPEDAKEFTFRNEKTPIYGIIEDFKLRDAMYTTEHPVLIRLMPRDFPSVWGMIVEVRGEHAATYNEIKEIYETIFEREMDAQYIDDEIAEAYSEQSQLLHLITLFMIIAIIISMLGLLAMSTYFIQQRQSETAVRKVFGSTRKEVFRKLVGNFLVLVAVAFIIAVPVAWYLAREWLEQFPYRINLTPWPFLAAGAIALAIAAVTVMWQSARAANENPIDALHKE